MSACLKTRKALNEDSISKFKVKEIDLRKRAS